MQPATHPAPDLRRIEVDDHFLVTGTTTTYAIGDVAAGPATTARSCRWSHRPRCRPAASSPPRSWARRGRPFRYRDKGMLATIGRRAAVGQIGPITFTGLHRVARLARRAPLLPDRVREPRACADALGLVLRAPRPSGAHHPPRRRAPFRLTQAAQQSVGKRARVTSVAARGERRQTGGNDVQGPQPGRGVSRARRAGSASRRHRRRPVEQRAAEGHRGRRHRHRDPHRRHRRCRQPVRTRTVQGRSRRREGRRGLPEQQGRWRRTRRPKVVVDFYDSKLNGNESRNATIQGCENDYALVGTSALFLTEVTDIVGCKDQAGAATGIPDMSAVTTGVPESCPRCRSRRTAPPWTARPSTRTRRRSTRNQGPAKWELSKNKGGLHGVTIVGNDTKDAARGGTILGLSAQAGGHQGRPGRPCRCRVRP